MVATSDEVESNEAQDQNNITEYCQVCKKRIISVKKLSIDYIIERTLHCFGKKMCYTCAQKASNEKRQKKDTINTDNTKEEITKERAEEIINN